jgi:hypothetical protein
MVRVNPAANRLLASAISPHGWLAASTFDRSIEVWETKCGRRMAAFSCDAVTLSCAFINNHDLAVGDAGGHVHFLRLEDRGARTEPCLYTDWRLRHDRINGRLSTNGLGGDQWRSPQKPT